VRVGKDDQSLIASLHDYFIFGHRPGVSSVQVKLNYLQGEETPVCSMWIMLPKVLLV